MKALAAAESLCANTNGCPLSESTPIFGSIGMLPRNTTSASFDIFEPPPEPKISVFVPQCGQTKPLMFSTTPMMGKFSLSAKVIAFLTTALDKPVGIVTITTPSNSGKSWATLKGSSPVPGGKSINRKSSSPQTTSPNNWRIARIFNGPRQIVGADPGRKKSIDITFKPTGPSTGKTPGGPTLTCCPSNPRSFGTLGPWMSASGPRLFAHLRKCCGKVHGNGAFSNSAFAADNCDFMFNFAHSIF